MKNTSIVYWSPKTNDSGWDWSILYEEPSQLISVLNNKRNYENKNTFFKCPSWKDVAKNTFVIKSPIDTGAEYELGVDSPTKPIKHYGMPWRCIHDMAISNSPILESEMGFYFFSEDDIEMTLSAPFFNQTTHLQYGAVIPGKFNISKWFRPINMEFNLWSDNYEIHLRESEPIAYVNFNTENTVILKRFVMNKELSAISYTLSHGGSWEPRVPLIKRYSRFNKTKVRDIVLKNIKENLI